MSVFLEVRHRIKPLTNTAFDLFVDFYAETVVPATERHGIDLIGAWKMTGGEMGWDLSIQRYESMAHVEDCLTALVEDPVFWSASEKLNGEIEIEEVTKLAFRTPFFPTEERLQAALDAKPDQPRQYMLAVLKTMAAGLPSACEGVGKLADTMEQAGALQLVTSYVSTIGRSGELTDLWILPQGPGGMLQYRAGDPLREIISPLREHAPEESIYFLNPLPYSKLQ